MSWERFSPEFSKQAVKLVIELGYSVEDASNLLNVPLDYLNFWIAESEKEKSKRASLNKGNPPNT